MNCFFFVFFNRILHRKQYKFYINDVILLFLILILGQVTQFTLDSTSGEIKTLAKLNFEQKMSYSLPLRVSK